MTITPQLLDAVSRAIRGEKYLCLDHEPSPYGLGGTFIRPKAADWDLRFHPVSVWPEGKYRYSYLKIEIGPRRHKQSIEVLVSEAVDRRDLRQLQREYVESL